jgi:hypothetical protein
LVPGRITAIVAMSMIVASCAIAKGAADIALLIFSGFVVGGATGPTMAWDDKDTTDAAVPIAAASRMAETRNLIRTSKGNGDVS